jgi:hypothetical protein
MQEMPTLTIVSGGKPTALALKTTEYARLRIFSRTVRHGYHTSQLRGLAGKNMSQ